jgi:hypothetical protein
MPHFTRHEYDTDYLGHSMDKFNSRNHIDVILTLWSRSSPNNIQEFSPYRKENTTLHHYKDQLVNVI